MSQSQNYGYATLYSNRDFADMIRLRILRWENSLWALNVITCILIRQRQGEISDYRRENFNVIQVMQPQAKECQKPSEAGRDKEEVLHWIPQKIPALLTP